MKFADFLKMTQVLRMLYGVDVASRFFENNLELYYNLSLSNLHEQIKADTLNLTNKQAVEEI